MIAKTVSYYGKLPTHGDFISQHMPRAFTEVWDSWLQESLVHWRDTFQDNWVADYLTMQPYRFVLSTGIAGEVIWCGVLLPSRDKAGRLFPFSVCIPLSSKETTPLEVFETHHAWLDQLEELAISCLMPDFDVSKFESVFHKKLGELASQAPNTESSSQYTCAVPSELIQQSAFAWHSTALKGADKPSINAVSSGLINSLLDEYCHAYSLWWTRDNADFMLCQGLPTVEMMPAFIDRKWKYWGWHTNPSKQTNKPIENNSPPTPKTSNDDDDTRTF